MRLFLRKGKKSPELRYYIRGSGDIVFSAHTQLLQKLSVLSDLCFVLAAAVTIQFLELRQFILR